MNHESELTQLTKRAIEIATKAWDEAHRGLPTNLMTRAAAIPATGILAAAVMNQLDEDDQAIIQRTEEAIRVARRAWELTSSEPPGNPIAQVAGKSVIGIIAAGILNYQQGDPRP